MSPLATVSMGPSTLKVPKVEASAIRVPESEAVQSWSIALVAMP